MTHQNIVDFLFELGHLKRIKHEGWRMIGVDQPESVADHALRTAQIAYILARMENHPEPEKICTMAVFHDMGECRIGDLHLVAKQYTTVDEARAVKDQVQHLGETGQTISKYWQEVDNRSTTAGVIAKDADMIDQALAAREYILLGHTDAEMWIDNIEKVLRTESARMLLKVIRTSDPSAWYKKD